MGCHSRMDMRAPNIMPHWVKLLINLKIHTLLFRCLNDANAVALIDVILLIKFSDAVSSPLN